MQNLSTYHGSYGEIALLWIHKRANSPESESSYKWKLTNVYVQQPLLLNRKQPYSQTKFKIDGKEALGQQITGMENLKGKPNHSYHKFLTYIHTSKSAC